MNGKGRSIYNIVIERFFRTLKHNNIYISDYLSRKSIFPFLINSNTFL